jgi:CTP:molybdopterin cytidylyltransferase MocA
MDDKLQITTLVLAAGKSSRMGRSKPLLPINDIRYASCHHLVPVEDEGVITDLDTMEDYEKYQPPK